MRRASMLLTVGLTLLSLYGSAERVGAAAVPKTALKGLDPIEFVAGKAVSGNKKITADYGKFRYVFTNEKNRTLFSKDPARYAIQGDGTCPVAPEYQVDPDLVMLHKGKIYAFATVPCMGMFGKNPEKYLAKWPGNPDKKK
jgi:YHS domain-containing protein